MVALLGGYQFVDLGPDGGAYDQSGNPKGLIHTTQGSTLASAEAAFRNYPPHIGYDPIRRIKRQYVRLDRHSYSLRGDESDDDFVIQVEIVGFAEQTHIWSDEIYRNIAADVIVPLTLSLGIPMVAPRFYGAGEGIVLASKYSPVRFSQAQFRAFSGWCGHQHAPFPDEHWDPGKFLIARSFAYAATILAPKQQDKLGRTEDVIITCETADKSDTNKAGILSGGMLFDITDDGLARDYAQAAINRSIVAEIRVTEATWNRLMAASRIAPARQVGSEV